MSLLFTQSSSKGYVELFCDSCLAMIGRVTLAEAGELASANVLPLCFDCDQFEAETVPAVFCPEKGKDNEPFVLAIDDIHFFVDYSPGAFIFTRINSAQFLSLAVGLDGGRKYSLSSSSNLHKIRPLTVGAR